MPTRLTVKRARLLPGFPLFLGGLNEMGGIRGSLGPSQLLRFPPQRPGEVPRTVTVPTVRILVCGSKHDLRSASNVERFPRTAFGGNTPDGK